MTKSVDKLAASILHHKKRYYAGKPEISDAEFDALEDQLRQLDPDHPVLLVVGAEPEGALEKVKHDTPMLSLQKTYKLEELFSWANASSLVGTYKLDGSAVSLVYEGGHLVRAKTRGNGYLGEDITAKVLWMDSVPKTLPLDQMDSLDETAARLEIRGEIICAFSKFMLLVEEAEQRGLDKPSQPRNIVAGILGRKKHIDLAQYFDFFAFDLLGHASLASERQKFQTLEDWGFRTPPLKYFEFEEEEKQLMQRLESYIDQSKKVMVDLDFAIDGLVFSVDDLAAQKDRGFTSHHPKFRISFKWPGQTAVTRIQDIVYQTSRSGIVTPVAIVEPVVLSGANIRNVTLHNAAFVKLYDLKPGDKIEIIRSGEVIPKFLACVESAEGDYEWPKECPSCESSLEFDGVRLLCPNQKACPAQRLGSLLNWIRAVGIEDLSEKRLLLLMEHCDLESIEDLYLLREQQLEALPSFQEKLANKIVSSIQGSKQVSLDAFLTGLGIPLVGKVGWRKIMEAYPRLEQIRSLSPEDIAAIKGFAHKTAEQITAGLEQHADLIDRLLELGVQPEEQTLPADDAPLAQKKFVLTGKMQRPRAEIARWIEERGGVVQSAVSQETDYLVCEQEENKTSSKMKQAQKWGTKIVSEEELYQLV